MDGVPVLIDSLHHWPNSTKVRHRNRGNTAALPTYSRSGLNTSHRVQKEAVFSPSLSHLYRLSLPVSLLVSVLESCWLPCGPGPTAVWVGGICFVFFELLAKLSGFFFCHSRQTRTKHGCLISRPSGSVQEPPFGHATSSP